MSTNDSTSQLRNAGTAVSKKRKAPVVTSEFCKRSCTPLYLDEKMADVHFVFDANGVKYKIPAHKYMLAIGSPVFDAMFYGKMKVTGDVTITDYRAESFKEFLQFFYLDHVELTVTNGSEVMYLIKKYRAGECFRICDRFWKENLTMETVGWILEQTIVSNRSLLRKFVLNRIMDNSRQYFKSKSFKDCSPEILKMILKLERLNVPETFVFDACIAWSRNVCANMGVNPSMLNFRQQLDDCFHLIQFSAMSRTQIFSCLSKYSELFTREELLEIINIATLGDGAQLTYFVGKSRVKSAKWQ
ncbi:BTB/POZ domain-containing protein 6-A-like [Bradysia coprophila]|uniref:BTB/POZ domain-containing protein 6-A-like n=1 Tax=Bradysia coprophila TaxID=38358 RepID=UPI00187DCED0|nr:BTB/POZ domain-containing protein 6-A-like [Bradysia coprophila]